jgi:hypothetical protein
VHVILASPTKTSTELRTILLSMIREGVISQSEAARFAHVTHETVHSWTRRAKINTKAARGDYIARQLRLRFNGDRKPSNGDRKNGNGEKLPGQGAT